MANLLRIILILMPFVIYVMWLRAVKRQQKISGLRDREAVREAEGRMARAVGFAIAAALAIVIWLAMDTERTPRDAVYVPPHTDNGKVIPGGFVDLPPPPPAESKPAP